MNYLDIDECAAAISYSLPLQDHILSSPAPSSSPARSSSVPSASVSVPPAEVEVKKVVDDAVKYAPLENVDYGALASNLPGHGEDKYYLTTAIAYTNGYPHMGHAYEFLTADALVRFYRAFGYDTYFLTGADEHGQKVASSAEAGGRTPQDHCDLYVRGFKTLNQRLCVSNSSYIRTTDPAHKLSAQKLWNLCAAAGDIYLDTYEGWYNQREELFVTDSEAEAMGFIDVGSGLPLKRVQEESYFFRMSKYGEWLINFIESNPSFIQPEQFRNNILTRLKTDPLKDLSVSRTSFSWGIPVPEGFDPKHVMYVWFDALSNYISGVNYLDGGENSKYWPAQIHLIGKDIVWFHSVIWPCMLKSAGVPLPQQVFCHGFVNASDGRKMSKSYNNTIDPMEILDKYSSDTIRYYSVMATSYGSDLNFSQQALVVMHNSELADILGNLVHRGLTLCLKYCDGVIPESVHDSSFPLPFDFEELDREIRNDLSTSSLSVATFRAMDAVRATNKFLTTAEPWKMKNESDIPRRIAVVRTTLEAIYIFSHYLAAIIPNAVGEIFKRLNTPPRPTNTLRSDFYNLTPGTKISLGNILFTKIEEPNEQATAPPPSQKQPAGSKKENKTDSKKEKSTENKKSKTDEETTKEVQKDKKEKKAKAAPQSDDAEVEQHDFTKIELRVGQIVNVWNHETAERLFCEEIDIGEGEPRRIASGLREHYTLEEMQGRKLIVVCNLKEAKLVGFVSQGMVLAAKSADGKVELVSPPDDAVVGERIFIEGVPNVDAFSSSRVKKFKVWESIFAPKLSTNADCIATWDGFPLLTAAGRCYVPSVASSPIG